MKNSIIIILLLLILGGGTFAYFNTQKHANQEKQQECMRSSSKYVVEDNNFYTGYGAPITANLEDSRYYQGFCYVLEKTTNYKENKTLFRIVDIDRDKVISVEGDSDFMKMKTDIFNK